MAFVELSRCRTSMSRSRSGTKLSHAGRHSFPIAGQALTPLLVEGLERRGGRVGVDGGVDGLDVPGDLGPVPLRGVLERVPDQVDDAGLHDGLVEHGVDALRHALEPVADQVEDVRHAAVLQLGQGVDPVLRRLAGARGAGPDAQHVAVPLQVNADRGVERAVGDRPGDRRARVPATAARRPVPARGRGPAPAAAAAGAAVGTVGRAEPLRPPRWVTPAVRSTRPWTSCAGAAVPTRSSPTVRRRPCRHRRRTSLCGRRRVTG